MEHMKNRDVFAADTIKCVICGKEIYDYESNNPDPVNIIGRCCDRCNNEFVIPARMARIKAGIKARIADEFLNS